VVDRHVFYNNSIFDGNNPAADAQDDAAIAEDKQALLPGQTATFANYTSYSRGINGLMIDVADLGGTPSAEDFNFKVGNGDDPSTWPVGPTAASITVRPGEGSGGSDRVILTFDDRAIQNTWLQATLLATTTTGLPTADVFYFGNAIGESGNSVADAKVNAADMLAARNNPRDSVNPAPTDLAYDYDRDGRVDATDMLIARTSQTHFLNALQLITAPAMDVVVEPPIGQNAKASQTLPNVLDWLCQLIPPTDNDRTPTNKATLSSDDIAKLLAIYR
jgi:hypothetical protein